MNNVVHSLRVSEIQNVQKPTQTQEHLKEFSKYDAKPFVKWVGGKRSILPILSQNMPENYSAYYEVFAGGAALFFELNPLNASLSDVNSHLISTYLTIRDNIDELIASLGIHAKNHNKDYYLRAREQFSATHDMTERAALMIYLNKTCYNGLYRVNKSGKFNVPIGSYKNPTILDETNLRNVSLVLQDVTILNHSFDKAKIEKGAFYYLDPPYHKTYSSYDGRGFADKEHIKLAEFCQKIQDAGAYFMLSNSDTDFIKELYKSFNILHIKANRSVSCKSNQRGKEGELLIKNYE